MTPEEEIENCCEVLHNHFLFALSRGLCWQALRLRHLG